MNTKKIALLLAIAFSITACGQKGPLIVDIPLEEGVEQVEGQETSTTNENEARINRQLDGSPSVIQR